MPEENMPTNLEEYMKARIGMRVERQETQRKIAAANRALYPWKLGMGGLLVLIIGSGIAAGVFDPGWTILTAFSVIGFIALISFFYSYSGKEKLVQFWSLQDELVILETQQRLVEEIWQEMLPQTDYATYYRQVTVPWIVEDYQRQSRSNRRIYLFLQMTIIVASLLVTGLTSGLDTKIGFNGVWLTPTLSFAVSLCTAVAGFFKFRERSFYMQQTADAIELEQKDFALRIRHYKTFKDDEQAFTEFAERVQNLVEEQQKRQQQLEQQSDGKEISGNA